MSICYMTMFQPTNPPLYYSFFKSEKVSVLLHPPNSPDLAL